MANFQIHCVIPLKSFDLDSTYNNGIRSNIVAEIRLVGDSLTWFGTGQGLYTIIILQISFTVIKQSLGMTL